MTDRILILDFGSQVTQLIARRLRETGVYCEIFPFNCDPKRITDFALYQAVIELRVQIFLILGHENDALASLEEAREVLPNNPSIAKWIEKLKRTRPRGEA